MLLRAHGQRLLSVQTGSMMPVFRPGDALIVESVTAPQLRPGEIISYQSPLDPRLIISHRLIKIDRRTGWLTTRGDALQTTDQPFPPGRVVGRAVTVAPRLGRILDFSHHPLGLALMVYLPALSLTIIELRHLWATLQPGIYRL
jgi:signal peptidase